MTTAQHVEMEADEYHAHPAFGATMLEELRESRRTFHAVNIAKTQPRRSQTPAMRLGTLVHMRLLEPAKYAAALADPMPELAPGGEAWNMRKPTHRDAWAAQLDLRIGSINEEKPTLDAVEAIAESVLRNWHARTLLEQEGEPEFCIFWTDEETGLPLKCMVDWWSRFPLDIKTTRDPSPESFAKDCVTLGYHRKRAHYLAGIQAFSGEDLPLVHLAVGNQPPYACCPYELDDKDFDGKSLGYRQWRQTLRELAECLDSGQWDEPWERQIVSLRLPGWAFSAGAYDVL